MIETATDAINRVCGKFGDVSLRMSIRMDQPYYTVLAPANEARRSNMGRIKAQVSDNY